MEKKRIVAAFMKLLGGVSITLGALGIMLSLISMLTTSSDAIDKISPSDYATVMAQALDKNQNDANGLDFSDIKSIMKSPEFKLYYWVVSVFCVLINFGFIVSGVLLVKRKLSGVWFLIAVSALYCFYKYIAIKFTMSGDISHLAFGAAWGVGNMGLAIILISWFWLWGSLCAASILPFKSRLA